MGRKISISAIVVFLLAMQGVKAQSDIAIGQWNTHFSYSEGLDLLQLGDEIFVATTNSLYSLDLKDGLCRRLGITEGLSDVGISRIYADDSLETVLICYANSNLDFYSKGQVYSLPDLYEKQMAGDKTIYNVCIRDHKAYLATGFGLMVVDMARHYIKESWTFQSQNQVLSVRDVCIKGDTIYAATAQGIYWNTLSNRKIAQFSTWIRCSADGLPADVQVDQLESYGDAVYAVRSAFLDNDTVWNADSTFHTEAVTRSNALYAYRNGRWMLQEIAGYEEVRNMCVSRGCLIVTYWNAAYAYTSLENGKLAKKIAFGSEEPQNALLGDDGYLWLADYEHGLVRQLWTDQPQYYNLEGPLTDGVWAMDANNSTLAVVHEAPHNGWTPVWSHILLSVYHNQRWINTYVDVAYRASMDVLLPSSDPRECYISSYLHGLLHLKGGEITLYDSLNSTLEPYYGNVRAGRMCMDSNRNLWVLNPLSSNPLCVKTPKGEWFRYNIRQTTGAVVGSILVDHRGWVWMTGNRESSLLLFDPHGTLANTSDDRLVQLNISLTEETGAFSYIYCIAEDKDGEIWLGTDKGIKIYYSPSRLFDYPGTLPYAPRVTMDSLTELLLYNEAISCIKVDPGNRKWIGTENAGVFLLSEDGETELLHFTKENSPLISNNVRDIAIVGSSGEVFIGTDKGLESFRYTATDPAKDYSHLKVFPNPVREDYTGWISICDLEDASEVKITDVHGGLVYRTLSNGGTAVWNGCRFDGRRVATGVYFVHVSDASGKEKSCGKILFIK